MKKFSQSFKTYTREEISKVKGGKRFGRSSSKFNKLKGHDRAMEVGASPCPPPEPDRE